mgnify:CR=1 FL=1
MRKKRLIILVLQVCLIIGFAFSFYTYVQKEIQPTEVYVFNSTIEDVNTEIQAKHIKKVTVPAKAVTSDFARDAKDIVGKFVTTKVYKGQYVYSNQLVEKENIDPFESMDLSQLRKISLPINYEDGFAGNVKRGDRIDLIFTGEGTVASNSGSQTKYNYSKVFLQDIPVYSVTTKDGYKFVDHSEYPQGYVGDENGQQIDIEASSDELAVITLAVTLEQAEEIQTRMSKGTVGFLGRFEDSESYETLGYVLGDYTKIFSGNANAETGRVTIVEDTFEKISK